METENLSGDRPTLAPLVNLIKRLRREDGCPWDRRQTARSMAVYLVEEVFELVDAIEAKEDRLVCEEAGDVLFQLLFIIELHREQNRFSLQEVVDRIHQKMVRRHPHVFGAKTVDSSEAVRQQWHEIKKREKGPNPAGSVLDGIPAGMPALHRAYRVSERAARTGFDWPDMSGVMASTMEEWDEFCEEWRRREKSDADPDDGLDMEFGDLLFTLANVARFGRFHPENALAKATRKFEARFRQMESALRRAGREIDTVSFDEMQAAWRKAKSAVG
jgi:MazG family protein